MKASILIVEDDKAVQRLMAAAMDNAGYHQEIAANGAEAVTLALSLQPQVILLDLGLPGYRRRGSHPQAEELDRDAHHRGQRPQ